MLGMERTTITLDPDLAAKLRRLSAERGTSFTATVNAAIRAGLSAEGTESEGPYREEVASMGVRPGIDLTKALSLVAELEDAEIVRKMELGR